MNPAPEPEAIPDEPTQEQVNAGFAAAMADREAIDAEEAALRLRNAH